jgi:hypothetical protein
MAMLVNEDSEGSVRERTSPTREGNLCSGKSIPGGWIHPCGPELGSGGTSKRHHVETSSRVCLRTDGVHLTLRSFYALQLMLHGR